MWGLFAAPLNFSVEVYEVLLTRSLNWAQIKTAMLNTEINGSPSPKSSCQWGNALFNVWLAEFSSGLVVAPQVDNSDRYHIAPD